jgi:hypothetical protein
MGTVDTLKAYEILIGADMPDSQARAVVSIVHELQESRLADVATKADLKELETRLLKWFIALLLGQTAFIVGILKLLK